MSNLSLALQMLYPTGDIKKRRTGTRESRNSTNGASVIHQWKIRPSWLWAAGINKLWKIRRGEHEEPENSTSTRATIAKQTSSSSRFNVQLFPPRSFLPSNERFLSALARPARSFIPAINGSRRFSKFEGISLFSISCQNYEFLVWRVTVFSSKHWPTHLAKLDSFNL